MENKLLGQELFIRFYLFLLKQFKQLVEILLLYLEAIEYYAEEYLSYFVL